jgi:precorrin-6B methylase 2
MSGTLHSHKLECTNSKKYIINNLCHNLEIPGIGWKGVSVERPHIELQQALREVTQNESVISLIDWRSIPESCHMTSGLSSKNGKRKSKKGDEARFERKARQCDAFAIAIHALNLPSGSIIVDAGCGSCGLTLPLAATFPQFIFIGVDIKSVATRLMLERANLAGLANVQTRTCPIASFNEDFDLAIALHACGQASDEIILKAVSMLKPYLVAPCCLGKLKYSLPTTTIGRGQKEKKTQNTSDGTFSIIPDIGFVGRVSVELRGSWDPLPYPRSQWLTQQLCSAAHDDASAKDYRQQVLLTKVSDQARSLEERVQDMYCALSGYADYSSMRTREGDGEIGREGGLNRDAILIELQSEVSELGGFDSLGEDEYQQSDDFFYRVCSNVVCIDRNQYAKETADYQTYICSMPGLASSAKSDLLIGIPPIVA